MGFFEAMFLAVVQGATEFLPISSSGHLVLGQTFLGISEPQLLFDIVLHVGTLLAVVVFYRDSIRDIVVDSVQGARKTLQTRNPRTFFEGEGARVAALVVLATIPTGVLGLLLERWLDPEGGERVITASVVCGILIVNGFILITHRWLRERDVRHQGLLTVWNLTVAGALLVGLAQGVAVLPGISRSGTTITAALLLGVTRTQAARFSFLLSIPAILGALVLEFDLDAFLGSTDNLVVFIMGALVAAVVGYLCLRLLVILLERAQFHHFAWYCWAIGIVGLIAL
jgi:undecaprenyl-diphosphatase